MQVDLAALRQPMRAHLMTQPIQVAFLGLDHPHGAAWRQLLQQFPGDLEVTALLPGFANATTSLEERYTQVPRYGTLEALLRKGRFDAAVVCLPNNEAPLAVQQLAAAGKHVLLEKPGARSAGEFGPALSAVRKSGVAFQSGYVWRYDEGADRLQAMVAEGRFGRLISIEILYVTSDVRRRGPEHYLFDRDISGGGFFNWLACHYIDLLFYITGRTVIGVTARTDVFGATPIDVEDGGTAILEFEEGGLVTLVGGYWVPRWAGENLWSFRGSQRWVQWDPSGNGVLRIHGPQPQWHAMEETFAVAADEVPFYGGYRGLELVRDWISAIRDGHACRNTPESAQAALAVIDAIYQSSCSGRRVDCYIKCHETRGPRDPGVL
jgi:predicted dehydrogenase